MDRFIGSSLAATMLLLILAYPVSVYAQWMQMNGPYGGTSVGSIAADDRDVIAATSKGSIATMGIYLRAGTGTVWRKISPAGDPNKPLVSNALAIVNRTFFASIEAYQKYPKGIIRTKDNGATWEQAGLVDKKTLDLFSHGSTLFALTDSAVFRSTDLGDSWEKKLPFRGFSMTGDSIYLFTTTSGAVYRSSDDGDSWSICHTTNTFSSIAMLGSCVYAKQTPMTGEKVLRSTDDGATWTSTNAPQLGIGEIASFAGRLFLFGDVGMRVSSDSGATWNRVLPNSSVACMCYCQGKTFVGTWSDFGMALGHLFSSSDSGATWSMVGLTTENISDFIGKAGQILAASYSSGVFRSTNDGLDWVLANNGYPAFAGYRGANCFAVKDSFIFLGTGNAAPTPSGCYRTSDFGSTWVSKGLEYTGTIRSIFIDGMFVYACYSGTLYRSSDDGTDWTQCSTRSFNCLSTSGGVLLGGTTTGIYRSSDNGLSWESTSLVNDHVYSIRDLGPVLIAHTKNGGVMASTDGGSTWKSRTAGIPQDSSGHSMIHSMAVVKGKIVIAANDIFYFSSDGGETWDALNEGGEGPRAINSIVGIGDYVFVGSSESGAWRRRVSEFTTSAPENAESNPDIFALQQNYPNPFNPSTTIRYGLSNRSHVTLTVFNTLGQQVTLLHTGEQDPGYHEVRFDGSNLPSGVYFYRMQAGSYVETKKLLLLR